MSTTEDSGAERCMDDYLKSLGLQRKKIAKDGSCLFRAVAEQVLHCQSLHTEVRAKCVDFLRQSRDVYEAFVEGDFEEYLSKLQDPQQWVGEVEINALAVMYKRDFLIFQEAGEPAVDITGHNFEDKVQLCFLNGNHYDSVYPIDHLRSAAVCQSILYELLYEDVFKVDKAVVGSSQRVPQSSDFRCDDSMDTCVSSDESDSEAQWLENGTNTTGRHISRPNRGRGRGGRQLSERVRRSLNPAVFRNVEYDVWQKSKRAQQKMDYCIAAGMHYSVGDQCQVCLGGTEQSYNATIKEVSPNNGPVTVYIDELRRKESVPLWCVRAPNDNSSWSIVASRERRISNSNRDMEERAGRGRGRGRPTSVAQAIVGPPAGQIKRQQSWPQERPTGEQSVKTRKSLSMVESEPSNLAERECMAQKKEEKEGEEEAVALELQLTDEQSFPALGSLPAVSADGGKRKGGGDKRRFQRNKSASSPAEDTTDASPPAGDRRRPFTPPSSNTAGNTGSSALAPRSTVSVPKPPLLAATNPSPPSAVATSAPQASPPPAVKPEDPPHSPPPVDAASEKNNSTSLISASSLPSSAVLCLRPAAPSPSLSSSKPSVSSSPPAAASASVSPPTFIAPIAPSPVAAHGFLPPFSLSVSHARSPSPSSSAHISPSSSSVSQSLPSPETISVSRTTQAPVSRPHSQPPAHVPVSQQDFHSPAPQTDNSQIQIHAPPPHVAPIQVHPGSLVNILPFSQPSLPQAAMSPPIPQVSSQSHSLVTPAPPPTHLEPQPPHSHFLNQSQAVTPLAQPHSLSHPSPHFHPPLPPHPYQPQPVTGGVHLQQLSQFCQDPLYPGFPTEGKGLMAPIPPYSSSKSGEDLPRDTNVLRFFFNLGVKAFTHQHYCPYVYLMPLIHAHIMQSGLPSSSAPPQFPPSFPISGQQDPHLPPQNPPTSMVPHYDLPADPQASLCESNRPMNPRLIQTGYPISQTPPHRMPAASLPWQQHQVPQMGTPQLGTPAFSGRYPAPTPHYPSSLPSSQGHPMVQAPGLPLYAPNMHQSLPLTLGYPPPAGLAELQVGQGMTEQLQPTNGQPTFGRGSTRISSPLEVSTAALVPAINGVLSGTPTVLTVAPSQEEQVRQGPQSNPPPSNSPVVVSFKAPDSMTTSTGADSTQSHAYGGHRHLSHPINAMTQPHSVGCGTDDHLEEMPCSFYRGGRRPYRGRGRSNSFRGRGQNRRRPGGEGEAGMGHSHYTGPHHRRGHY